MSTNTKLILIEGLPGSGKTTLAKFLSAYLEKRGIAAKCLLEETQPHPLRPTDAHHPAHFAVGSRQQWRDFVAQAEQSPTVTVAEGILFQDSIRLLMQHGVKMTHIAAYADAVAATLQPLNPALIYLTQPDVSITFERICRQRGEAWQHYVVAALTHNAYAKQHGLAGYEGAVTFLKEYRDLCDFLVGRVASHKLMVETSTGEWSAAYDQITRFFFPGASSAQV